VKIFAAMVRLSGPLRRTMARAAAPEAEETATIVSWAGWMATILPN
jgi:hypothetical protein